jgi:hypothetical protein
MDWIERWVGFAPDNGDGTLEMLLLLAAVAVLATVAVARHSRSRSTLSRLFGRVGSART